MVTKVTNDVLADNAVQTNNIANAAITAIKIANSGITTDKINFSSSILTVGSTTRSNGGWGGTYQPAFQHHANNSGMGLYSWSNVASGGYDLEILRSRSTTVGTLTNVILNDELMAISAGGAIGGYFNQGATIIATVDNTPNVAANSIPTSLSFATTPLNAQYPVTRLAINSGGQVTKPYQPSFHATSSNAPTAGTEWIFNTATYNRGNYYNAATGRFTAPVAGVYYFYVYGLPANASTTGTFIGLRRNGVVYAGSRFYAEKTTTTWHTVYGFAAMQLNANDYVSPWNEGSTTLYNDANYTGFGGYLIG